MSAAKRYADQPITPGRVKALYVTANNLIKSTGLYSDIEDWKQEFLYACYQVESTKQLTIAQADDALNRMKELLGDNKIRITYAQKRKIEALQLLLEWSQQALWDLFERQAKGRRSIDMLTRTEANKVIIGMQRIFSGGDTKLYDTLNRASARYLHSAAGQEELKLHQKRVRALKSLTNTQKKESNHV